ncbi:MAG: PhoU domain-containing protein, partial [Candidatus Thermoplasmatota archaeon]|nr:PhoU domain-containing protein [Candidatus Thermoplasmatota archaeon]
LVVIKDLLDPAEMPLDKTLKRMHIIVKNMYEDAMSAFKNSSKKIAEDVISRDNDVDRLHWLVARQTNIILRNISLAEKMGVTPREASTCFLISRITERIGDHAVRIAENSFPLFENKLNEEIVNSICSAGNVILDIFNKSIGAFFRGNVKVANENIEKVKKFEGKLKEINTLILKQKGVTAVSLGHILESIRRVGEYGEDISESVINQFVEKEK